MKNKILIIVLFSIGLSSCNNLFKHDGKSEMEKEYEAEIAKCQKELDSMLNSENSIYTKQDAEKEKQAFAELAKLSNKNIDTNPTTNLVEINLIKAVQIKEHDFVEGAEGITIVFKFNSFTNKKQEQIDELLRSEMLQFKIQLLENDKEIQVLQNYNLTIDIPYFMMQFDPIFIPYAVLNLQPGNHSLSLRVNVSIPENMEINNKLIDQDFIVQNINFNKPAIKIATVYIDYIESTHNDKNHNWDLGLVSDETNFPDIRLNFKLGDYTIWSYSKEESYTINDVSQYKLLAIIGENDNLHIKVEDVDIMSNDFIANITLKTKTAKRNEWITIDKAVDHLKSCKIRYKVE